MKVLITGGNGQLGQALQKQLTAHTVNSERVDITIKEQVFDHIQSYQPDVVIHSAAYTNVDGCAKDPQKAYLVNGYGTQNVALACQAVGSALVHVSTNEVFAGDNPAGYEEWMDKRPLNAYGRSKAHAEYHVETLLQNFYIVRTSWVYSPIGRNFIHAILKRAQETGKISVVTDEVGNPTYAHDLAQAIAQLIETGQYGTYHFTNAGSCSRWAFANEIVHLAGLEGVVNEPILGKEFRRASTPPPFGVLKNIAGQAVGITLRPWQEALADYMQTHVLEPSA